MKSWWREFGTPKMPVRQSDLSNIAAQEGCGKRFFYERDAEVRGEALPESDSWKLCIGTATHKAIERALGRAWPQMVDIFSGQGAVPRALTNRLNEVVREELANAPGLGADGLPRPVQWYDEDPNVEIAAAVAMVVGAIRTTVERASSIVGLEVPWASTLEGFHKRGTIDLVYRRKDDDAVCAADWKTGARKMDEIVRDHGYQVASYSHALEHGVLWPGEERETRLGVAPAEFHIVHLRDFVPYVKKPKKGKIGDLRGPGWYASKRTTANDARLRVSLRTIVGTVRMGRFLERLGEQCRRCPFRGPCLSDGSGPTAKEARQIERVLEEIDLPDLDLPQVA